MNVGKAITIICVGLVGACWLSAPGTGQRIAAMINAMWGNIVTGLQPLVAIATQLGMLFVVGYVVYLLIRRAWRR